MRRDRLLRPPVLSKTPGGAPPRRPSAARGAFVFAILLASLLASLLAPVRGAPRAATFVWVDEAGVTHMSDDPSAPPEALRERSMPDVDRLRALWGDAITGPPPVTPAGASGTRADRVVRLLRGAIDDLRRGETARATAALHSARRLDPKRAEPHWYLALIDRQRGRYDSAASHLRAFLDRAGPELESWRVSARRRLDGLVDERRLADRQLATGPLQLLATRSPSFRIELDARLSEVDADYASTVLGYLEEARERVSDKLGVAPLEPLGVVFYGRAAYDRVNSQRFSFQTVGFFDGRIHVASPAHPSGALRSLLFHEYTHAVFREQTGADRPYWLNEGLAEQMERVARRQPVSTRSERASLRARLRAGDWLPLRRLAPSFSGLDDEDARAAYLEAVVSVEWIAEHTNRVVRRRLLQRLGQGWPADQALYEALGLDTSGLDAAVRTRIRSEFPES